MNCITVKTTQKEYAIAFCKGFETIKELFSATGFLERKLCIITDNTVSKLYQEQLKKQLQELFSEILVYSFEAGEKSKNLESISDFYSFYLENHFDRKTVIAALGGGVCGDMAGFSAATYMRGIPFVQIPTTLLAQVDSSVGGKVGVDFKNSKNMIGAFYQPEFVYINIETLKTLPKREFSAGMAEVIKYGCIVSYEFYQYIIKNKEKIKAMKEEYLQELIKKSCYYKAEIVSKDEKETGIREILNFGHTIGHAVETLKEFQLLHGECVAIGMVAAMNICVKKGFMTTDELTQFIELLKFFDLPVKVNGVSEDSIYAQMFLDKKVKNNKIGFVLLKHMGQAYCTTEITTEEFKMAIASIL